VEVVFKTGSMEIEAQLRTLPQLLGPGLHTLDSIHCIYGEHFRAAGIEYDRKTMFNDYHRKDFFFVKLVCASNSSFLAGTAAYK
jgi:hypothetical protein